MISEKDVKALSGITDKQFKFAQLAIATFILFELFITFNNFSLAIDYGQAMGLDFEGILAMWNAEPDLQKKYIGYEVQSLHRLNMAIINFGVVFMLTMFAVSMSNTRNRNKRILASLEQCGSLELSKNA